MGCSRSCMCRATRTGVHGGHQHELSPTELTAKGGEGGRKAPGRPPIPLVAVHRTIKQSTSTTTKLTPPNTTYLNQPIRLQHLQHLLRLNLLP